MQGPKVMHNMPSPPEAMDWIGLPLNPIPIASATDPLPLGSLPVQNTKQAAPPAQASFVSPQDYAPIKKAF